MPNQRKISNPLTVIAIFAGIAEVSGTVTLVNLGPEGQATFIWFVMLFPALLILIFFAILMFNSSVLYAPSDFRNDEHYLDLMRIKPIGVAKRKAKKAKEYDDILNDIDSTVSGLKSDLDDDWEPLKNKITDLREYIKEPNFDVDDVMLMLDFESRLKQGEHEEKIIESYKNQGLEEGYLNKLMVAVVQPLE